MYNYNSYPNYAGLPYINQQSQLMQYNSQTTQPQGLKGRPVSSLEEVRAAQIDFDGSLFVFPDIANKKIYTKQINLDGTAAIRVYSQSEESSPTSAYVTRDELNNIISNLQKTFIRKDNENESEQSQQQPKSGGNSATVNF